MRNAEPNGRWTPHRQPQDTAAGLNLGLAHLREPAVEDKGFSLGVLTEASGQQRWAWVRIQL